jgi:hypothetical protein
VDAVDQYAVDDGVDKDVAKFAAAVRLVCTIRRMSTYKMKIQI